MVGLENHSKTPFQLQTYQGIHFCSQNWANSSVSRLNHQFSKNKISKKCSENKNLDISMPNSPNTAHQSNFQPPSDLLRFHTLDLNLSSCESPKKWTNRAIFTISPEGVFVPQIWLKFSKNSNFELILPYFGPKLWF